MTIEEVQSFVSNRTIDGQGRIANLMFFKGDVIAHLEARLPKNFLKMPDPSFEWTLHWRSAKGMEQRVTSTDLKSLLARFGPVDLQLTCAESLDEILATAGAR
jgi:hypothetical protein